MLPKPDQKTIDTIKHAARLLSGAERRAFQAQVVLDHCNGNLSQAKTLFGWHQETVRRGLLERKKRKAIPDRPGRGRTERVFFGQGIRTRNEINGEGIAFVFIATETYSVD